MLIVSTVFRVLCLAGVQLGRILQFACLCDLGLVFCLRVHIRQQAQSNSYVQLGCFVQCSRPSFQHGTWINVLFLMRFHFFRCLAGFCARFRLTCCNLSYFDRKMPYGLIAISESVSAFERLDDFFDKCSANETTVDSLLPGNDPATAIQSDISARAVIHEADFGWNKEGDAEHRLLTGISLKIRAGELVACIGPVGSGKSSLLLAMLNELFRYRGTCTTYGRVAYCGQDPWILNADLRQNIVLFGTTPQVVDEKRYSATLHACCLLPDVAQMPAGDRTEIGEKGVTLSGGQKARLALARAIYSNADLYLLDDPLSSVDASVAKQLKKRLFGNEGMLRQKAVVIVTHQLHILPIVDRVLVMSKGCISHDGPFQVLLDSGVDFGNLLQGQIKSGMDAEEHGNHSELLAENQELQGQPETEDERGSVVIAEDRRIGKVSFGVYKAYIQSGGGLLALLALATTFTLSQGARSGSDVWVRFWSSAHIPGRQNSFYALIFLMFSSLAIIFAGVRAYIYADRSTAASRGWYE
jgi:ABC-type multidrug transport system ATPase subunit